MSRPGDDHRLLGFAVSRLLHRNTLLQIHTLKPYRHHATNGSGWNSRSVKHGSLLRADTKVDFRDHVFTPAMINRDLWDILIKKKIKNEVLEHMRSQVFVPPNTWFMYEASHEA